MTKPTRRDALLTGTAFAIPPALMAIVGGCNKPNDEKTQQSNTESKPTETSKVETNNGEQMKVQYLEIVTPKIDSLCNQYASIYDVTFAEPDPGFGGARIAKLDGGGMIGIRKPMRESEAPVVRPYLLVEDIKKAVKLAAESGAEIAMNPTPIPDHGMFAIVIHGGIDCGFWQN